MIPRLSVHFQTCCQVGMVTDHEALVAEGVVWSISFLAMLSALNGSQFAITAAGVVPYGGPKSLCTSSIVQIIFSFGYFEIS